MGDTIVGILISSAVTLITCLITNTAQNRKTIALIEYKIDELTKHVERHNSVVERTYELERKSSVLEEKQRVANKRIDDLERSAS